MAKKTREEVSLVQFGNPLREYEDDEVPSKKPINIEDQIVTDENGRRRFHGAFTGGFSAGYYNTVGTVEGWVPSTFVSSRKGRADRREQKPEDFMDTEDMGDFGIAPTSVRVTEDFADASRKRPAPRASEGPIPGEPVLERFIIPVSESIGVRMLRKMGWKPGQGIGPRVKTKPSIQEREQSPEAPKVKVYGCTMPPTLMRTEDADDEEDFTLGQLYAPDDVDPTHFTPKTGQHGIGYKGLDRMSVLTSISKTSAVVDRAKKLAISGEAFGVGAFERVDESIYTTEDMSQYDFEIRDDVDPKSGHKKPTKQIEGPSGLGKVLAGFHLSDKPPPKRDMFPPPELPRDFKPIHRVGPADKESMGDIGQGMNRHGLSASDRGKLIEESKSKPRKTHHDGSVLNLLSAQDRARLEVFSKFALGQSAETNAQKYSSDGRFRPFAADPLKQQRFEIYTKLFDEGAKMKEVFSEHQPQTMTDWEKMHESEEFHRAAILYKPLRKTAMMSRFVPASQSGEVEEPKAGLTLQGEAAKAKKYGDFTREKFEWHPDKILCRRFNVPNPYPDSTAVGVPKEKRDKYSIFDFLSVEAGPEAKRDLPDTDKHESESSFPKDPVSNTSVPASSSDTVEETPIEKPTLDLFKTIFEDSDSGKQSSSSDEEEESPAPPKPPPKKVVPTPQPTITKSTRDTQTPSTEAPKRPVEPSKGIFANVDFDRLNTQGPPVLNFISDIDVEVFKSAPPKDDSSSYGPRPPPGSSASVDLYGPTLPPNPHKGNTTKEETHHQSRKKSHKDKSKKHKKEKRKSKHKRSHSKRRSSSSSSSTQDEVEFVAVEEIDFNASILQAMKKLSRK